MVSSAGCSAPYPPRKAEQSHVGAGASPLLACRERPEFARSSRKFPNEGASPRVCSGEAPHSSLSPQAGRGRSTPAPHAIALSPKGGGEGGGCGIIGPGAAVGKDTKPGISGTIPCRVAAP